MQPAKGERIPTIAEGGFVQIGHMLRATRVRAGEAAVVLATDTMQHRHGRRFETRTDARGLWHIRATTGRTGEMAIA